MRCALVENIGHQPGCRVLEASGPVEAQRAANSEKIDLLMMDLCVPETNEIQLAFWFSAMFPETRILLASDSLWELDFQFELRDKDKVFFLAKPFTRQKLASLLRQALK